MSKSIKITQDLKDKNLRYGTAFISNSAVGSIVRVGFPNKFYATEPCSGGYASRTDIHDADGWQTPVIPVEYNPSTQRLGNLTEVGVDHVYLLINKTDLEIQNEVISSTQGVQQSLIQQQLEAKILEEAQLLDDNDALETQALFTLWQDFEDEYLFPAGIKIQDFVNNELKLFKSIQPNNKRDNTRPIGYPAGWTLIEFSGGIEIWSQPTGGDGKYLYLDPLTGLPYLVEHNGQVYENTFTTGLNVWEPGVYGWQIHTP